MGSGCLTPDWSNTTEWSNTYGQSQKSWFSMRSVNIGIFLYKDLWSPPIALKGVRNFFCTASHCVKLHKVTWLDCSFSFEPWTLYRPWTLWCTHWKNFHHATWCSFAAGPYMTHALCVVSSARSFSIVPWTPFRPWSLYQPWTLWSTH